MYNLNEKDIIAYTEAWRVIQLMDPKEKELIPMEIIDFLDKHKDLSKGVEINLFFPLEEQGLSEGALCVLGIIMMEIRKQRAYLEIKNINGRKM